MKALATLFLVLKYQDLQKLAQLYTNEGTGNTYKGTGNKGSSSQCKLRDQL